MRKLYLLLVSALSLFAFSANAQTAYEVEVTNFSFTPSELEINVGDTVRWTNVLGLHSVDGRTTTFPENPESFGNEVAPAPWTYEYVFTVEGEYDYLCAQHPNAMTGSISVGDSTTNIDEIEPDFFAFFPNPVTDLLYWKWDDKNVPAECTMTLFNIEGKQVASFSLTSRTSYDVSKLSKGVYTYSIQDESEQIQTGKLLIQPR